MVPVSVVVRAKLYMKVLGGGSLFCSIYYVCYPFDSEYYFDNLPILREFTEAFTIDKLSLVDSDLNVKETKKV